MAMGAAASCLRDVNLSSNILSLVICSVRRLALTCCRFKDKNWKSTQDKRAQLGMIAAASKRTACHLRLCISSLVHLIWINEFIFNSAIWLKSKVEISFLRSFLFKLSRLAFENKSLWVWSPFKTVGISPKLSKNIWERYSATFVSLCSVLNCHGKLLYRVFFLTGPASKSSKCWEWQNPYQKSESGPIQQ